MSELSEGILRVKKRRSDLDHSVFVLRNRECDQEVNQSKCKAETRPADKQVEDAQFPAVLQKAVCSAPAQKNGEVGTLLRVIGQAGLSRLGNDALAAVADDVQPFRFLKVCHGP